MYKQKQSSKDFTTNDLPSNRKEVFFDKLKNQYHVLFKSGLVLILFFVPFILSGFFKDYSIWYQTNHDGLSDVDYWRIEIMYSLLDIPLHAVLAIGLAGLFRVIKNLSWDTPVFFKEDFKDGVKKNSKQFIIVSIIFSIISLLCKLSLSNSNIPELVRYIPSGILIGVVAPLSLVSLNILNLYNAQTGEAYQLSTRFFFGKAGQSFLAYVCVISPLFILFISNFMIKYIVLIPVILFVLPLCLLAWFLYTCSLFDRFMNEKNYPSIYDKGVYRKDNQDAKD